MRIIDADEFLINMVEFFRCIPTLTNGQTEMLLREALYAQRELEESEVMAHFNKQIGIPGKTH